MYDPYASKVHSPQCCSLDVEEGGRGGMGGEDIHFSACFLLLKWSDVYKHFLWLLLALCFSFGYQSPSQILIPFRLLTDVR